MTKDNNKENEYITDKNKVEFGSEEKFIDSHDVRT